MSGCSPELGRRLFGQPAATRGKRKHTLKGVACSFGPTVLGRCRSLVRNPVDLFLTIACAETAVLCAQVFALVATYMACKKQ